MGICEFSELKGNGGLHIMNRCVESRALEEGFVSMFEDGINKAVEVKSTVEEIFRVARL